MRMVKACEDVNFVCEELLELRVLFKLGNRDDLNRAYIRIRV